MGARIGQLLALVGIVLALIGIFALDGVSIEFPGIILGGVGYYLGLRGQDRLSQVLGIVAVILCVISIFISGIDTPPR